MLTCGTNLKIQDLDRLYAQSEYQTNASSKRWVCRMSCWQGLNRPCVKSCLSGAYGSAGRGGDIEPDKQPNTSTINNHRLATLAHDKALDLLLADLTDQAFFHRGPANRSQNDLLLGLMCQSRFLADQEV